MSPKENNVPASGMDLPGVDPDYFNDLLMGMFLKEEMTNLSNRDLEQLTNALTKEEEEGLDALGSSEEFIEKVLSAADKTKPASMQSELPTSCDSIETHAEPDSDFYREGAKEDVLYMIDNVASFEKQGRVTLPSEYRKATKLGRGGQGIVYLVQGDDDFSAAFALKVFLPQAYDNLPDFTADMTRMRRIAKLIHEQSHDDLVDIGWFGQCDGVYTMLMQYIDGYDLRRLLQPGLMQHLKASVNADRWETIKNVVYSVNESQQLALQPAIAVYIIERVLRGLGAMHSSDIIHGDIKPSNIMLNASGIVKIIDIGSAFEVNSPPKRHHFTPAYAAPEFLETKTMSKQSDLASVGYMLIELLSGKPITNAVRDPDESTRTIGTNMTQELLKAKQSLPDRLPDILPPNILASNHLVELCRCLIDPDLKRRFPGAAETIVDQKGTYQFNKDLILSNLGVCNFQEVSQWLADVKQAMRLVSADLVKANS